MGALAKEVRAIQNPALGAMLQWRACAAHVAANRTSAPMPLPLLFVVLPVVFHEETSAVLLSTRTQSGLRKFVEKFRLASTSKTDLVLAVAPRAVKMRPLSMESLRLGIATSLVGIDSAAAGVFPLSTTPPKLGIPTTVRPLLLAAERLGSWLGELSPYEAAIQLQVHF